MRFLGRAFHSWFLDVSGTVNTPMYREIQKVWSRRYFLGFPLIFLFFLAVALIMKKKLTATEITLHSMLEINLEDDEKREKENLLYIFF
ncbi:hypothetical protein DRO35_05865 [Candidatus Bathyarchaeota archaeon]|nr:MAG: hypothetical protein DRO35_05865 [Candidatus Bathyarchaeota archaeon]